MVGVLVQACQSIGLGQIEGGEGSNLLQILDCGGESDAFRAPKRQRLIENAQTASGHDTNFFANLSMDKSLLANAEGGHKMQVKTDLGGG
jgi:hypothetical protein